MKIYKYNKLTLGAALLTALVAGTFASCLKSKNYERYDQSPALVSFQYTGNSEEAQTASLLGNSADSFNLEVTLSVSTLTLKTPVTVTLSAYDQGLDSLNSAILADDSTADTYTMLPQTQYTLPNTGVVTINPGEQIVKYKVTFAGDQIDFANNNYALVLHMTTASGASIASNLNTAIVFLKLKNAYEGDYACSGYFVHPSSPRAIDQEGTITTVTLLTSQAPFGDLGGDYFWFDTDPTTGKLSNWVPKGATPANSGFMSTDNPFGNATYPGDPYTTLNYPNTYDFTTQVFSMHYGYNAAGGTYSREVYEKYTRE